MAKFYGTAGTRRGSVGNEVYYIQKTQNIVRRLPAFVHNPRTIKQQTQRIRMKNCLLGLKNVKSELDLSTFTNQEVIENKDNAYIKNNVNRCSYIDKRTSNIANFPSLSDNIVCSYGTLTTLPLSIASNSIGIFLSNPLDGDITIKTLSIELMNTYNFLRNEDTITFFYYYCENIEYDNDQLYHFVAGTQIKNMIQVQTGRKTFKINTNNENPISMYGLKIHNRLLLTLQAKTARDTFVTLYEDNHPCYILCFYARLIAEDQYNFPISSMSYNKGYEDMLTYSKTPAYIDLCLQSFDVNLPNY